MRIISQDNVKDFPYEMCTIWVIENKIFASPIGEPDTEAVMSEYSTREKAEKAMQMLHDNYAYNWKLEHGLQTYYGDEPIVFRFPAEDEL